MRLDGEGVVCGLTAWCAGNSGRRQISENTKAVCGEDRLDIIRVLVDADQTQSLALGQYYLLLFWFRGDEVSDNGMRDHASRLQGERVHAHVGSDGHDGRM